MTTTTIAERSVRVTHLSEGPVTDLAAPYAYAEAAESVRLTAEMMELAGGVPLHLGRAWACQLDLLYLDEDGDTDGVPLGSHGTATVTLTGTEDTVIAEGMTVSTGASPLWAVTEASTIPHGGTTRDRVVECETMGVIAAAPGALDTISPAVSGLSAVTNALAATPGAEYAIELRILDRRTRSLIQRRLSTVETVAASGVYQITADTDQRSRLETVRDGYAGRLVLRWAAADDQPPPVGLWAWELAVTHPGGAQVEARGLLEVLP